FRFAFPCSAPHRDLHSFPTRRSSDLARADFGQAAISPIWWSGPFRLQPGGRELQRTSVRTQATTGLRTLLPHFVHVFKVSRHSRSEEHTSELQSRGHLVCRLLLEKKK